ncbi:hypothetical protein V8G54_025626 [Vigna mungo]|uniref:Uncharacterized protein n=1 Tax=Vigna mungo TaxID=3915 RepID=A0AAQ3MYY4_VIGMU
MTGEETMLSSQSDEERPLLESIPLLGSSSMLEIPDTGAACCWCWKTIFSKSSLRHFSCASSLSLTVLPRSSFRLSSCSSLFLSSSCTAALVCSSSTVVHMRDCLSSSIDCTN